MKYRVEKDTDTNWMMTMLDRLQYRIFYRLWYVWHCRLARFRPFMQRLVDRYDPDLYTPDEIEMLVRQFGHKIEYRHWDCKPRPFWHLCCNGNSGGWRTDLCDWLENKWRCGYHD